MISKLAINLRDLVYRLSLFLNNAGTIIIMAMMLLITADVLLRNAFNLPIQGSIEIVEYLMAVLIFFLFANGQIQKTNVNVDMFVIKLPATIRRVLAAFNYFIASLFFGLMTIQMFRESYEVYLRHDVSPSLSIPEYPFMYGASIGVLFLTLVLVVDFFVVVLNAKPIES